MSRLDELIAELCPDGVCFVKLGDLCDLVTKQTGFDYTNHIKSRLLNEKIEGSVPYIQTKFFSGRKFDYNTDYYVPSDIVEKFPKITLDRKCLLFSIVGASIGNVGLFPGHTKCFLGGAICVAKIKAEYNADYLYYCVESAHVQRQIRNKTKGAGQATVTVEDIRSFTVPFPPLPVQQEIVRILDHFTEITAELQKQLDAELTARKKQYEYYLSREFTVLNAPIHKIGEITNVFSAARVHKNEWKTEGVPFFRSSDVISSFGGVENSRGKAFISFELYENLSAKSGKVKKGDLLITGGGTIGIPYLVPNDEPLYMKDADLLCIQKNDSVLSEFLYFYFLTPQFRDYLANITHDATIPHYTIEQIKKTPIPVPSRNEQEKIVNTISRFFDLCNDLTSGLPAEIAARQKQYEYYRDKLLTFKELPKS